MAELEELRYYQAPSHSPGRKGAARIALAVDAMSSGSGGLWLQYEKLLEDDLASLRKRSNGDSAAAAAAMLKGFSAHSSRIATAALMAGSTQKQRELLQTIGVAERLLDAKVTGVADQRRFQVAVEASFVSLEKASSAMFEGEAYSTSAQPFDMTERRIRTTMGIIFGNGYCCHPDMDGLEKIQTKSVWRKRLSNEAAAVFVVSRMNETTRKEG